MPALFTWWRLDAEQLAPRAHPDTVAAVGEDLLRRMRQEHRCYHTTRHLVEMMWALEELQEHGAIDDHDALVGRVAAWFHDAVYDISATGGANESASADLAVAQLGGLGAPERDITAVTDLVLATERHQAHGATGLRAAFHDADLWILSAPQERFDEYCAQVRQEYADMPDATYAAGRAAILEPFLTRASVYATGHARATWEGRARVNLGRELTRLAG